MQGCDDYVRRRKEGNAGGKLSIERRGDKTHGGIPFSLYTAMANENNNNCINGARRMERAAYTLLGSLSPNFTSPQVVSNDHLPRLLLNHELC
jgi:hypothetical protein